MLLGANFLFLILFSLNGSLETSLNAGEANELNPQHGSSFRAGLSSPAEACVILSNPRSG